MGLRKSSKWTTQLLRIAALACVAAWTHSAAASEIVRWVDDAGVTQFTDGQFSPGPATVVQVQPANGMVVPTGAPTRRSGPPAITRIGIAPKKNKRGWRGYSNRGSSRSSNGRAR
ncbi:MAG: DUF4124 domain-containing protein [Gammaproteobacteria bacterium]|nr:DUF4124 domain-containing protein [Gammaproteobacteria bacterium]